MILTFKQKFFAFFDSFDVKDENGEMYYKVKGKLAFGHKFVIYDKEGKELATVKEEIFHLHHTFAIYVNGNLETKIVKKITFLKPEFNTDNGYKLEGNWIEWDYKVTKAGKLLGTITRKHWHITDTYELQCEEDSALITVCFALAMDSVKDDHSDSTN